MNMSPDFSSIGIGPVREALGLNSDYIKKSRLKILEQYKAFSDYFDDNSEDESEKLDAAYQVTLSKDYAADDMIERLIAFDLEGRDHIDLADRLNSVI